MAQDPEELRTAAASEKEEEEGGPVKSFLEHLEDLRWVLIKSLVAFGVAFIVCLVAGDQVIKVMTWPLSRARISYPHDRQVVTFLWGTNRLGVFQESRSSKNAVQLTTNQFVTLHLELLPRDRTEEGPNTNLYALGVRMDSDPTEAQRLSIPIVSLGPAAAFIVAVQVAVYAGILISSPFILYFVASFVFPALKLKERKYVYRGLFFGIGLFMAGVGFCYFVLMPVALRASVAYTEWLGFSVQQWRAEDFISFVSKFMLGMGLGFEMPVILLVLVRIGILNYSILSKARRYVIVINLVLGALLTTPEVLTQILMALPLQVLFEITIWIAWYWERQDKKRLAAEQAAAAAQGQTS
ncbi:MAG: twin-arginine translocase subunit TatC [Limisphaerales bacterium]